MSRSQAVAADPIVSTDFTAFSPPTSKVGTPATESCDPFAAVESERQPLLGDSRSQKKHLYRARPLWLVPFAILAALVRGMTIAPRVQIFTQLSCNALHHPYNHTVNEYSTPLYTTLPYLPDHLSHISPLLSISKSKAHDDQEPLSPSQECLRDPLVQAKAAKLQTITTTTMGMLSAFTNGWWGHFGERHGRITILAIATFGWLLTDTVFMLVSTSRMPWSPYAHNLLLLSPVAEGALGGWSLLQSATSAYISDCTSPGSRARIFSRFTGVFYVGFSLGPIIGGWILRHPFLHDSITNMTSVFAIAVAGSLLNLLLLIFVFPESLSKDQQAAAMRLYAESMNDTAGGGNVKSKGLHTKFLNGLLSPLAVFLPATVQHANGYSRQDWSLTFVACSVFGFYLSMGVFQLKYLYAEHVYGWGAEQLSSYISLLGSARALYLLFGLPLIIVAFKPVVKSKPSPPPRQLEHQPHRPLKKLVIPPPPKKAIKSRPASSGQLAREVSFDLNLTRFSFFIDFVSQIAILVVPAPSYHATSTKASPHSQALFVLASSLNSLGSGAAPTVQSLALCILQSRASANGGQVDTGKLFGAIAVLQAMGSMILGPLIFGMVYSATVATVPKAIFVVAGSVLFVSLVLSILVQPPKVDKKGKNRQRWVEADEETHRGRSRVSKDLRKGPYPYYSQHSQAGSSSNTAV